MRITTSSVVRLKTDTELFFRKFTLEKCSPSETQFTGYDFIILSLSDVSILDHL